MAVATKQQLIDYCLRSLGAPVLEININVDQIEDRVDEALEYWKLYHPEGVEKVYLKSMITASVINITTSNANLWSIAEVVTGSTSGAKAEVVAEINRVSSGTTILVKNVVGTFLAGETITGSAGHTAITASVNPCVLGVYDNKYMAFSDAVYGISRVIPFNQASSSKNIFDLQYQLRLNDLYDLTSTSIIYYKTVMSHLAMLDLELNGQTQFRFNRRQGKLYLDINWATNVTMGQYVVVEAYRALDPTEYTKVFNEAWLKHYLTALLKKQWATNIKKFQGLQLPGGVTLDGNGLYDEATKEIDDLENELMSKSAPLEFFLG